MNKILETSINQYISENIKYKPDHERFRQFALKLGLNPILEEILYTPRVINNVPAKGTIITPFATVLAKAWETEEFLGFEIQENDNNESITCVSKRRVKDDVASINFTAHLKEFKPKHNSLPWANMPNVMLRKCAIVNCVRQLFADKLSGLYITEEMDRNAVNNNTQKTDYPKTLSKIEDINPF